MKWLIKYRKEGKVKEGKVDAPDLKAAISKGEKKGNLVRRPIRLVSQPIRKVTNNPR